MGLVPPLYLVPVETVCFFYAISTFTRFGFVFEMYNHIPIHHVCRCGYTQWLRLCFINMPNVELFYGNEPILSLTFIWYQEWSNPWFISWARIFYCSSGIEDISPILQSTLYHLDLSRYDRILILKSICEGENMECL